MIRFMCLSVCIFFTLFLNSGCSTVTWSIKDPDIPPSEIRMKYPYKFYVTSIVFYNYSRTKDFKIKIAHTDEQTFTTDIRKQLAVLYPQIFVAEPNDSAIPITYDIVHLSNLNFKRFVADCFMVVFNYPFFGLSFYTCGLFPMYLYTTQDIQVHAQVSLKLNTFCQREVAKHERSNFGLLGFFNTRKLLPDFSDKDIPPMEEDVMLNTKITSSECSEKFLKLFVYALQELDHTQIQLLYNEKYHPKVDFILP